MAEDHVTVCMTAVHIDEDSSQDKYISSGTLPAGLAEFAGNLKTHLRPACREMRAALLGRLRSRAMPLYICLFRTMMALLTVPVMGYCLLVSLSSHPELLISPNWCIVPFALGLVVISAYEPATNWHDLPLHVRHNRWHLRHFRRDWRIQETAIGLFGFGIAILLVYAAAALSEERYDGWREQLLIPRAHIRLQISTGRSGRESMDGVPHIRLALSVLILSYAVAATFVKLARLSSLPRSAGFIFYYYRQVRATLAV